MRRTAFICLGLWTGGNFALGVGIVFAMLFFGQNAPGLHILYSSSEIAQIDGRALATINGLAIFANACAAAYCGLALVLVVRSLKYDDRWAFAVLWVSSLALQAAGFASDSYFGHRDLAANLVSTALLICGLLIARVAMKRKEISEPRKA